MVRSGTLICQNFHLFSCVFHICFCFVSGFVFCFSLLCSWFSLYFSLKNDKLPRLYCGTPPSLNGATVYAGSRVCACRACPVVFRCGLFCLQCCVPLCPAVPALLCSVVPCCACPRMLCASSGADMVNGQVQPCFVLSHVLAVTRLSVLQVRLPSMTITCTCTSKERELTMSGRARARCLHEETLFKEFVP